MYYKFNSRKIVDSVFASPTSFTNKQYLIYGPGAGKTLLLKFAKSMLDIFNNNAKELSLNSQSTKQVYPLENCYIDAKDFDVDKMEDYLKYDIVFFDNVQSFSIEQRERFKELQQQFMVKSKSFLAVYNVNSLKEMPDFLANNASITLVKLDAIDSEDAFKLLLNSEEELARKLASTQSFNDAKRRFETLKNSVQK